MSDAIPEFLRRLAESDPARWAGAVAEHARQRAGLSRVPAPDAEPAEKAAALAEKLALIRECDYRGDWCERGCHARRMCFRESRAVAPAECIACVSAS